MDHLNLIRFASFKPNWLSHSNTWVGHIPFAAWLVKSFEPKVFVELGTYAGNSYFSFCQSVKENSLSTKCYAIDTWQGDEHGGFYGEDVYSSVNAHNREKYSSFSTLIRSTFDEALTEFDNNSIDLFHIDGLHTYEAVKHDFMTWLPKLKDSAAVIFHDTNIYERDFGVHQFWKEIKEDYPYNLEFPHSSGLGVIWIGNKEIPERINWLDGLSKEQQILIDYFIVIGRGIRNKYLLDQKNVELDKLSIFASTKDKEVQSLNQEVWDRVVEIDNLHSRVLEGEKVINERDTQIVDARTIINNMQKSFSWKITSPVRYLGKILRRIIKS